MPTESHCEMSFLLVFLTIPKMVTPELPWAARSNAWPLFQCQFCFLIFNLIFPIIQLITGLVLWTAHTAQSTEFLFPGFASWEGQNVFCQQFKGCFREHLGSKGWVLRENENLRRQNVLCSEELTTLLLWYGNCCSFLLLSPLAWAEMLGMQLELFVLI